MPPPTHQRDSVASRIGNRGFYAGFSRAIVQPDRRRHASALQMDLPNGAINYNLQYVEENGEDILVAIDDDEELETVIYQTGEDRSIFGLDFPYSKPEHIKSDIARIKRLDISEECKEKILGKTLETAVVAKHIIVEENTIDGLYHCKCRSLILYKFGSSTGAF